MNVDRRELFGRAMKAGLVIASAEVAQLATPGVARAQLPTDLPANIKYDEAAAESSWSDNKGNVTHVAELNPNDILILMAQKITIGNWPYNAHPEQNPRSTISLAVIAGNRIDAGVQYTIPQGVTLWRSRMSGLYTYSWDDVCQRVIDAARVQGSRAASPGNCGDPNGCNLVNVVGLTAVQNPDRTVSYAEARNETVAP